MIVPRHTVRPGHHRRRRWPTCATRHAFTLLARAHKLSPSRATQLARPRRKHTHTQQTRCPQEPAVGRCRTVCRRRRRGPTTNKGPWVRGSTSNNDSATTRMAMRCLVTMRAMSSRRRWQCVVPISRIAPCVCRALANQSQATALDAVRMMTCTFVGAFAAFMWVLYPQSSTDTYKKEEARVLSDRR